MNLTLLTTLWLLQAATPAAADGAAAAAPAPAPRAASASQADAATATAASVATTPSPPAANPTPPQKVDAPGIEGVPVRVERRQLVKARKTLLGVAGAYYARGDYFITPGLQATWSHYLDERNGVEARAGFFMPFLTPAAQQVFTDLGFIPDVPRALGGVQFGYRRSLGYGKVLLFGTAESLVHFDLQLALHVGGVFTDRGFGPSLSAAPALLARIGPSWTLQADVAIVASLEAAEFPVVFGVVPLVAVGYAF